LSFGHGQGSGNDFELGRQSSVRQKKVAPVKRRIRSATKPTAKGWSPLAFFHNFGRYSELLLTSGPEFNFFVFGNSQGFVERIVRDVSVQDFVGSRKLQKFVVYVTVRLVIVVVRAGFRIRMALFRRDKVGPSKVCYSQTSDFVL
jgi:hypothetical protein